MRLWLSFYLVLPLFACASFQPVEEPKGLNDSWVLEAKVNYRDNQQIRNGLLRWEQQGENYEIKLSGIITGEFARLSKTSGQFNLRVEGQEYRDRTEINNLLVEKTGIPFPADNLQYWLRQEPNPHQPFAVKRDIKGRIVSLTQDLWQIHYDYKKNHASHITAEKPPYRILLVIIRQNINS